jgi:formate C-acetyltransferase
MGPGCSPSPLVPIRDAIVPIHSYNNIDFTVCGGGNAVFDISFPLSKQMNEKIFVAFVRACIKHGCPTMQPNFVRVEDLIDAKSNPEAHKDIIVRISGLSAYFVALSPDVQDEIISRNMYNA